MPAPRTASVKNRLPVRTEWFVERLVDGTTSPLQHRVTSRSRRRSRVSYGPPVLVLAGAMGLEQRAMDRRAAGWHYVPGHWVSRLHRTPDQPAPDAPSSRRLAGVACPATLATNQARYSSCNAARVATAAAQRWPAPRRGRPGAFRPSEIPPGMSVVMITTSAEAACSGPRAERTTINRWQQIR